MSASNLRARGILGGTFDPVHVGHLRVAIEALELLQLDAVHLIPLNVPNHRGSPTLTPAERMSLLESAVDGARLIADGRELARGGTSYTIETLESLRDEFPDCALCLLLGVDAFADLCEWHRWDELLDFCHLVVVSREVSDPSFNARLRALLETAGTNDPATLRETAHGRIYFQTIPLLPISSTDIRARIAAGRDIAHLVAPTVLHLIKTHHYYANTGK